MPPPPPIKSREARLAEALDIYDKLRELCLLHDEDVAELRAACQRFVRSAEASSGRARVRSVGRTLQYDLRRREGQVTSAVLKKEDDRPRAPAHVS